MRLLPRFLSRSSAAPGAAPITLNAPGIGQVLTGAPLLTEVAASGSFEELLSGVMGQKNAAELELSKVRAENMMLKASAETTKQAADEALKAAQDEAADFKAKLATADDIIAALTTERDTLKTAAEATRAEIQAAVEKDVKNRQLAALAASQGITLSEVPPAIKGAGAAQTGAEFQESLSGMDQWERSAARLASFRKPAESAA